MDDDSRPLTPEEMRSLDVGDFFTRRPRPTLREAFGVWRMTFLFTLPSHLVIATVYPLDWTNAAALAMLALFPVLTWRFRLRDWQRARDAVATSHARKGTT